MSYNSPISPQWKVRAAAVSNPDSSARTTAMLAQDKDSLAYRAVGNRGDAVLLLLKRLAQQRDAGVSKSGLKRLKTRGFV
jgi:hypothetical protein